MKTKPDLTTWLRLADIQSRRFEKHTWIPLRLQVIEKTGEFGEAGYRKNAEFIETVILPLEHRADGEKATWHSVSRNVEDGAWVNKEKFLPPGTFRNDDEEVIGFYPVLRKNYSTGESTEWVLNQEIEFSLELLRCEDTWVRPEENYVEVVKLQRDEAGDPTSMEIKAEFLRDYLCARKAALIMTGAASREVVEVKLDEIPWKERQSEEFDGGYWMGNKNPILEGGRPVGMTTMVLTMSRESVDPTEDMPIMAHPTEEKGMKSSEQVIHHEGPQLEWAHGEIVWKQWVEPGQRSPRVEGDRPEPAVPFFVDNQGGGKISGNALKEYRGWLWFKPGVIRALLKQKAALLKWYTCDTGEVGPAPYKTLHFGTNKLGLINVAGYKMAELPEWVQSLWAPFSIPPEGGLSEELHASQNLAKPASTIPPERLVFAFMRVIDSDTKKMVGAPLFASIPSERDFFKEIHRFYDHDFDDVCELAKRIYRIVVEAIQLDAVNLLLGPKAKGVDPKLKSIKRLKAYLDGHGADGKSLTGPLAGLGDLRQGDAHLGKSTATEGLGIFKISEGDKDYQAMNRVIMQDVAWSLGKIAEMIREKGPLT